MVVVGAEDLQYVVPIVVVGFVVYIIFRIIRYVFRECRIGHRSAQASMNRARIRVLTKRESR